MGWFGTDEIVIQENTLAIQQNTIAVSSHRSALDKNTLALVSLKLSVDQQTSQNQILALQLAALGEKIEALDNSTIELRDTNLLLTQKITTLTQRIGHLEDLLLVLIHLIRVPGPVSIKVTQEIPGENGMSDVLVFNVVLPKLAKPNDIQSREVTVTISNGTPQVFSVGPDEVSVVGLKGDEGAAVHVRLVDIDNAGNRSPDRDADATLIDTIAPVQPGEVGIEVVAEEHHYFTP